MLRDRLEARLMLRAFVLLLGVGVFLFFLGMPA